MLIFLALTVREDADSRWRRRYTTVASRPLMAIAAAGILFIVATDLPFHTSAVAAAMQGPLFGVASGLVLAVFLHGDWTRPVAKVLAPIGLASYGVYLWHFVILSALVHHGVTIAGGSSNTSVIMRLAFLVAVTVPAALASWLLLERPLLRRTTGWERRRTVVEAVKPRRREAADTRPHTDVAPAAVPSSSS
jgi:peptidoglycan/LPS O-acetylase OafA/YrhL